MDANAAARAARRQAELVAHAVSVVKIGNKRGSPPLAALALDAHVLLKAAHAHLVAREPAESIARRLGIVRPPVTGATPRGRKAGAQRRAAEKAKREGRVAERTLATWLGKLRKVYDKIEREAWAARIAAFGPYSAEMTLDEAADDVGLRMAAMVTAGLQSWPTLSEKEQANVVRMGGVVIGAPRTRAQTELIATDAKLAQQKLAEAYTRVNDDSRTAIPRQEIAEILAAALLGEDARTYMDRAKGGAK